MSNELIAKKTRRKVLIPILLVLVLAIALFLVFFGNKLSPNLDIEGIKRSISKPNIEEVKDSVVMIETYDSQQELLGTGSGFCAYKSNWIITNFHVIEGARWIKVITDDGTQIDVSAIKIFNKKDDLAILEIEGTLTPLAFGDGNELKIKDQITAIGSPRGERNTVSEGIISNVDEKDIIRITAPISPGSSGGVLLDKNYCVIGITNAGITNAQNLNFAININVLSSMYKAYKDFKFDVLNETSYPAYIPSITEYNTDNQLEMLEKSSIGSYYNTVVTDLNSFFLSTDPYAMFDNEMNKISFERNSFSERYNNFSSADKELVADLYIHLLQYETRTEKEKTFTTIKDGISNWTTEEFIMELDIMRTYELAIFLMEVDSLKDEDSFVSYLNDSSLSYESRIILYRLFHDDSQYDEDIFNFFNEDDRLNFGQTVDILRYLGLDVDADGTVYW